MKVNVPKYLHTEDYGRAFLTISCDVYGNWCAGYHVWNPYGDATYQVAGPYINDAKSIEEALEMLEKEMKKDANS